MPLEKTQNEAEVILREFKDLKMEFERKKKELEDSAVTKLNWATGLAFVPFVNAVATPLLIASSGSDMVHAVVKGAESDIQEAASHTVSKL